MLVRHDMREDNTIEDRAKFAQIKRMKKEGKEKNRV